MPGRQLNTDCSKVPFLRGVHTIKYTLSLKERVHPLKRGQENKNRKDRQNMARKLIIDGNAVYEIDEECMLKRRVDGKEDGREKSEQQSEIKNSSRQKEE